jgi:RNA polymerase sigma-70 factor (ECF subfamily)
MGLSAEEGRALAANAALDPAAREELARHLRPRVRKLAASVLRNAEDAEDAAQLALFEITRAAASFRGDSCLETWADRIALRTAIRVARQRRLASVRTASDVEPDELQAPSSHQELREGLPQSIRVYLDQLPEARRTALVLRHVMGYSIEEIAELTETSVNTVKDRLLSAREQVRRMVRRETNPTIPHKEGT